MTMNNSGLPIENEREIISRKFGFISNRKNIMRRAASVCENSAALRFCVYSSPISLLTGINVPKVPT